MYSIDDALSVVAAAQTGRAFLVGPPRFPTSSRTCILQPKLQLAHH
jgi:hypothetical protein